MPEFVYGLDLCERTIVGWWLRAGSVRRGGAPSLLVSSLPILGERTIVGCCYRAGSVQPSASAAGNYRSRRQGTSRGHRFDQPVRR